MMPWCRKGSAAVVRLADTADQIAHALERLAVAAEQLAQIADQIALVHSRLEETVEHWSERGPDGGT